MSSPFFQHSLDTHKGEQVVQHHTRHNESDEDSGCIDRDGEEADNSYMYLCHAGYDLLSDLKRKFKLARAEPSIVVGSADGPSADDGHPCGNDDAIDLISGGEEEESALSGKENNSKQQ